MTRNVFRDFTETRQITFRVGEHEFSAYPDISLGALAHVDLLRTRVEDETQEQFVGKILEVIYALLHEESAERFQRLLAEKGPSFIGVNKIMELHLWLSEEVADRPTQESGDSSDSSTDTGESSTDGASAPDSI